MTLLPIYAINTVIRIGNTSISFRVALLIASAVLLSIGISFWQYGEYFTSSYDGGKVNETMGLGITILGSGLGFSGLVLLIKRKP